MSQKAFQNEIRIPYLNRLALSVARKLARSATQPPKPYPTRARASVSGSFHTNPRRTKPQSPSSIHTRSNHDVRDRSPRKAHRHRLGHHNGRHCPCSASRRRIHAHHLIPLIGTWNRQHRPSRILPKPQIDAHTSFSARHVIRLRVLPLECRFSTN